MCTRKWERNKEREIISIRDKLNYLSFNSYFNNRKYLNHKVNVMPGNSLFKKLIGIKRSLYFEIEKKLTRDDISIFFKCMNDFIKTNFKQVYASQRVNRNLIGGRRVPHFAPYRRTLIESLARSRPHRVIFEISLTITVTKCK